MEALVAAPAPSFRLVASRYPPVGAFDDVASAADLAAVIELEGWTNDRLVAERLRRLPNEEWVFGRPNASVAMAAFLHASPSGARFSGPDLGAWYAGAGIATAIAEVAHHLRREAAMRGRAEQRRTFRCYRATLAGSRYLDLRGTGVDSSLLDPLSYATSQPFGERLRAGGGDGLVYPSVRHLGGVCVACFRPRQVTDIVQAAHYDVIAPIAGRIVARTL